MVYDALFAYLRFGIAGASQLARQGSVRTMTTAREHIAAPPIAKPTFGEFFKVWLKIGCVNFGGPAGQIAMMHRIVVDEKKWIDEPRFLHALNFSMLMPGPEAQKLATYIGWLLHGVRGGLTAGILFVLPGALVMLGLSLLYALGRGVPLVDGALFGIKAAVLVIVVEALIRIGKRALKTRCCSALPARPLSASSSSPCRFPLIVIAAALIGFLAARSSPALLGLRTTEACWRRPRPTAGGRRRIAAVVGLIVWWAPVALAVAVLGPTTCWSASACSSRSSRS